MEKSRRTRRTRVSFSSDAREGNNIESTRSGGRSPSESFRSAYEEDHGEKIQMEDDNDGKKSEFAASIAAAAYAIYSLEETRAEYERLMVDSFRESFRDPKTDTTKSRSSSFRDPKTTKPGSSSFRDSFRKSIKLDQDDVDLPHLGRSARRSSSQIGRQGALVEDHTRRSSTRGIEISGQEQQQIRGDPRVPQTRADAWERARLEKISKWYERMNKKILDWENEKKKIATINMERRKAELDRLKRINFHHHANKIEQIEDISKGARSQLEEKKRSEEAYAKEKARKIRSTGKVPVHCLCFEC